MSKNFVDKKRLDEITKREAAAQGGPWKASLEGRDHTSGSSCVVTAGGGIDLVGVSDDDIEFIAHARQDIPYLVAEVRRLMAILRSDFPKK